tara:strand:+ start:649 stop:1308 length:660 start_codon:yes stop_codon:yes gene_type:complete
MHIDAWFATPIYNGEIVPTKEQKNKIERYFYKYTQENGDKIFIGNSLNITGDVTGQHQISELEEFEWINEHLYGHIDNYLRAIGVNTSNYKFYIQKSWPVICDEGGGVAPHAHMNAHLSAVFYIRCGPDNGGDIIFGSSPDHPLNVLPVHIPNTNVKYTPTENQLLIFPSSLRHQVTEFYGKDFRFSISYDIMITTHININSDSESDVSNPDLWVSLGD